MRMCAPCAGTGLEAYATEPRLDPDGRVRWVPAAAESGDKNVLRGVAEPFQPTGGLRVLDGKLGRAIMKTSAVAKERHVIEAPARVFHDQEEVQAAFKAGELNQDVVAVVRFQGPKANGMPELHRLMPPLGVLQDKGYKVALVTDGRLSGASGKVPAAIHVTPEAADGGAIGQNPGWRHGTPRWRGGNAGGAGGPGGMGCAGAGAGGYKRLACRRGAGIVRGVPQCGEHGGYRGEHFYGGCGVRKEESALLFVNKKKQKNFD